MAYSERTRFTSTADEKEASLHITACPFCQSDRVKTTSKTISDATYWRCLACGEIWNPSRTAISRSPGHPRW